MQEHITFFTTKHNKQTSWFEVAKAAQDAICAIRDIVPKSDIVPKRDIVPIRDIAH